MLRRMTALVICLIGTMVLFEHRSQAVANQVFGNATYCTGSHDVPKLTLIGGSRTAYYGRLHVSLNYEGHYALGDFNRDGRRDAAVVLVENEGGNLDDYSLAFLINDGTKLVHERSVHLDFWAIINSVRERAGKVVVDVFVHQEEDCHAGPTKRVKKVFDYLELGPDTLVPVAQAEDAPSATDVRYVDRNQEIQDIYNTRIPSRIRKAFTHEPNALLARKFMVVELAPVNDGGFQAVILFEGAQHPFWAQFAMSGNEDVLRSIEPLPERLDEALLDEVHSLAYERFWL
ncbi:MAG: hypothetical protein A3C53_05690 [Omnitrophica WOR_2 bacterium RIFCSPHIGHO2_02_FULL_68_15]|nr:MAG: hypothetical protein A3C53_05690 [Omnitrophica WOR_2 bacterium RIFCSPHIGHO2_02_FULL_68_15]